MLSGEIANLFAVKIFFIEFTLVTTPIFIYDILVRHVQHRESNVYGGFKPGLGDLLMAYRVVWAIPA